MKNLFEQLFYQHKHPLLVVRTDGYVEKANSIACELWAELRHKQETYLWQLTSLPQKDVLQQLSSLHAPSTSETAGSLFLLTTNARKFRLNLLASDTEQLLIECQEEINPALSEQPLPEELLNAILNGIDEQLLAILDKDMRYVTFNKAYLQEYSRIFAIEIAPGDKLLDTLQHLPDEQQKILPIWEQILKGKTFSMVQTFGHKNLSPTTYRFIFHPLKDYKGQLMGVLYQVKDSSKEQQPPAPAQEAEKSFRALAENTPDIVVRYGPDMQILFANTAVNEETGSLPEDVTGKRVYDLPIIGNIPESYLLKIQAVFETAEEQDLISTYNNNGVLQDYYSRFIPEKDASGAVISVIAVSRNISSLHKAQKELQQARDFVFMADVIPQLIWISEPNGNVSFFNEYWYTYTGMSVEHSLLWGWQKVVHPEDIQATLAAWQQALEQKIPYEVEYRLRRFDGSYRWFIGKATPLLDEQGNALKWYGFCADIHDQKQNRTELIERVQEFDLLNQMIPQIVWSTLPTGKHVYFNQRWFEYSGLDTKDTYQSGWKLVLHPEDYERTDEAWSHSLQTGETYQIEYRLKRYDDSYRWFIGRAIPLRDSKGHIIKWFGTCTDVHDYKQQREQLAQKNYELQQINSYLDQFVHTAAHDLRSPVANMKLLHEMLLREEDTEKQKKLVDTFRPLLNRLDNTIVGLVEIVQMQETHSSLVVQAVDPAQLLLEVREEYADKIALLKAHIVDDISLEKPLYYLKPYLESILKNLLSNALKYHDPSRKLIITIKGSWQGKYYQLSVEDTGLGIDLSRHSKNLFKPFKRLSSKGEGLGIGLHLVQNMVQRNGGHLEVSSQPGKGTCFTVLLNPYEFQSQLI